MIGKNGLVAGLAAAVPTLALLACQPVAPVSGRALFVEHCATCHGDAGMGDGPVGIGMDPAPANLTTIAQRNGGKFDYAAVMSMIDGYKLPDRGMPRFGDLLAQAEYVPFDSGDGIPTPVPIPLLALATYLEEIQVP